MLPFRRFGFQDYASKSTRNSKILSPSFSQLRTLVAHEPRPIDSKWHSESQLSNEKNVYLYPFTVSRSCLSSAASPHCLPWPWESTDARLGTLTLQCAKHDLSYSVNSGNMTQWVTGDNLLEGFVFEWFRENFIGWWSLPVLTECLPRTRQIRTILDRRAI